MYSQVKAGYGVDHKLQKVTYVCVSPLGEKNQAPTEQATTTTRPMRMLHLD